LALSEKLLTGSGNAGERATHTPSPGSDPRRRSPVRNRRDLLNAFERLSVLGQPALALAIVPRTSLIPSHSVADARPLPHLASSKGSREQANLSLPFEAFFPVRARAVVLRWIDFRCLEVYEAGAMLVTLLAYPVESEETRSRVRASLCSRAIRAKCLIEPYWASSAQSIKPIYALRAQSDINRDLLTLERRLRHRAVAGRMVIAFLKDWRSSFSTTPDIPIPTISRPAFGARACRSSI
jgi:hypothetical protein